MKVLGIALCLTVTFAAPSRAQERSPLIVMYVSTAFSGAWTAFVLYDDGLVIRCDTTAADPKNPFSPPNYASALLSPTQRDSIVALLQPDSEFSSLGSYYDSNRYYGLSMTDGTTYTLHFWLKGEEKRASVYGAIDSAEGLGSLAYAVAHKGAPRSLLALVREHVKIRDLLSHPLPGQHPWLPDSVDVTLESGQYVGGGSKWPASWPAPGAAAGVGTPLHSASPRPIDSRCGLRLPSTQLRRAPGLLRREVGAAGRILREGGGG